MAIKFLKENDVDFYSTFICYVKTGDLNEKFKLYSHLVKMVFADGYELWGRDGIFPQGKDRGNVDQEQLIKYWSELTS